MRRLLSTGFSKTAMIEQQPLIMGYIHLLIQQLREKADDGKTAIDIHAWCNYCTFDMISDLAFGEAFGCLRESTMHPWISLIRQYQALHVHTHLRSDTYFVHHVALFGVKRAPQRSQRA